MKKQVFNPYLPSYEYVPDGEPRVFGDRLYVYGSHDRFNGKKFCMNDYICWSTPTSDLSDWRYEGIIYKKINDPRNKDASHCMWAPDVTLGKDNKYYLYYCLDYLPHIGVAVCDTPAGEYKFLGFVKHADGTYLGDGKNDTLQFDPGIFIDDDGKIYLYSGNTPAIKLFSNKRKGSVVMQLEDDMLTIKGAVKRFMCDFFTSEGTGFKGHEFFEASSIRKIDGKYYFIYSSVLTHELCYAVSDKPDEGFEYGGTLVSNCDVGLMGIEKKDALNYYGNTHGSIACVSGEWYVFYHRQTNRSCFSRQACAERLKFLGGKFMQSEITSCGLNGKPLLGSGEYEARIACNLMSKNGTTASFPIIHNHFHPAFTQSGEDREENGDQYIENMRGGAVAGYKYFAFPVTPEKITITVRGKATGEMWVSTALRGAPFIKIPIVSTGNWTTFSAPVISAVSGEKVALYFEYRGKGAIDFTSFKLE